MTDRELWILLCCVAAWYVLIIPPVSYAWTTLMIECLKEQRIGGVAMVAYWLLIWLLSPCGLLIIELIWLARIPRALCRALRRTIEEMKSQ